MNLLKIAYDLYAMNFNQLKENDRIILSDQNNNPEYVIFENSNQYHVIKLKNIKDIIKQSNINEDDIFDIIVLGKFEEIEKNINFYEIIFVFKNIKELYNYFVNKEKMEEQEFQKYFNTDYSETKKVTYKNIDITVEKGFERVNDIKKAIDKISKIKYKDLFDGLLINFKSKITERDDHDIGGNRVSNQYGYKNVINIEDFLIEESIFHELGHIYQEKYLTKDEIEKIYNTMLQKNVCCFSRDIYLQINNMVPEFFANYYTNELNKESKKFVEDYILK